MEQIKRMRDVVRVYDYLYDIINAGKHCDIAAERLTGKVCYRHETALLEVVRIIAQGYQTQETPDNIISTIYNTFRTNEKETNT